MPTCRYTHLHIILKNINNKSFFKNNLKGPNGINSLEVRTSRRYLSLPPPDHLGGDLGQTHMHWLACWPLAGFLWHPASPTSQLMKPESLSEQLALPSPSMPPSPWILEVWCWRVSEEFSFISDTAHQGNCHGHQAVTVYGCGYLNSLAICFDRHHIKWLK